jgi:hypothetical protein
MKHTLICWAAHAVSLTFNSAAGVCRGIATWAARWPASGDLAAIKRTIETRG